jgi:PAS domain S-box-containing protein
MKILIVDDKPENLYLVESILKAYGHVTISARNGAEALGFANKEKPDLIVSDILMPVMDGYSLCIECKKDSRLQNIPFVFYTATYTDPKDEEFALSLGADRFVLKPQDPDVFIKIIDECLEEVKKEKSKTITNPELPETVILKEYNQTLIRKLEDKMRQTEENERNLKRYVKELEDSLDALKKTEKALKDSEERYRLLQENSLDAILLTSPDGSILSANKAACEMFRMTEKEICERGRNGIVDINDPRLPLMLEERRIKGKVKGELIFLRNDGSKFTAEISSSVYEDSNGDLRSSIIIRDITERKKAETLLSESEKKYRTLITQSPDGIFVVDLEGNFISVNKSMCEELKYSEEELLSIKIWDLVPDKFKEPFQKRLNKIINGEIVNEPMEYEVIGKDKKIHYVEILSAPFYKENILIGFQGIARDISERKRAEEALRFNEQQLTSIYNTVGDVIFYLAVEPENQFRFLTVNPAFSKITGIPTGMIVGKTVQEVIPPSSLSMVLNNYNTAIKEKKLVRWEETSDYPAGKITGEVSVRPVFDSKGVCTHLVGSVHDITERKLYEDAIRNSEEKFRTTFEEASVGMLLTSLEGKIILANNAVVSMLGYSKVELVNKRFTDFTFKDDVDASVEWMNKMISGKMRTHRFEKRYVQKNGDIVYIDANIALMKDSNGNPLFFVTHLVNITQRKLAEKALREQDIRLRKLASQIPGMIYQFMQKTDGSFCVPYCSDGIRDIFGYSPEDVRDDFTPIVKVILPKDVGKVMDSIFISAKHLSPWICEFRVQQPKKEIQWLLGQSIPEKQKDGSILWHGFVTSITERKQAEEKVNRLAAIVESSEDGIISYNLDGIITSWNFGAEKIYGYSESEVFGKPMSILLVSKKNDEIKNIIQKIKTGESIDHYEAVRKRKDGQLIHVSLTVSPMKDFEGNIVAVSTIARDITERKKNVEEIQKLNRVLSVISHINEMIIHTKNKNEILEKSCKIAVQYGVFSMAWIGMVDENDSTVKPVTFYGKEEGYLSTIKSISIKNIAEGKGPTGMAIRNKKYFYCNDIEHDPGMAPWRKEALKRGFRSSIALPIFLYGKVIGAFTLYVNEINFFNERELKMLEEVTSDISYALEMSENDEKRVLAENALKESEENFRSIYENSTLGIYRSTPDGKILMASPALISMLGYSFFEELIATKDSTMDYYVNKDSRSLFKKIIEEKGVIHGFETEWIKADGTQITIRESSKAIKDNNGNTLYYEGTVENITERKELEKKMKLLAYALESVSECVSITDKDDIILFVNDSFLKTYGYSENELIGKHISIVRAKESLPANNYETIIKDTLVGGWKGELINKKKDGTLFPISLSTSIIKDHKNNPIALIGVATDITETKKAREELIRAKELAEKSDRLKTEFLAQMSHEIRTPINIITSNIEFIQSEYEDKISGEFNEIFDAINLSSQRIIRTIELIISMAELQTGNFELIPVDIDVDSDILAKLNLEFERIAVKKNLQLIYANKANYTKLFADEYCLKQIFANLIDNAIKYTKEGKVIVKIINNADGEIEVSVKDTGIGISEDYLSHIFIPFSQEEHGYSRTYEGNGLGLAIVKRYCELNNATISVKSKKGEGSTFIVTFHQKIDAGKIG